MTCPYCGPGPCRTTARTADGHDLERFHRHHPRPQEPSRDPPVEQQHRAEQHEADEDHQGGECPQESPIVVPHRGNIPGGTVTDMDAIRAMLDRARIGYTEAEIEQPPPGSRGPVSEVPAGSRSIMVEGQGGALVDGTWTYSQPRPGGYSGFFAELVFGPDGTLLAVWAWE